MCESVVVIGQNRSDVTVALDALRFGRDGRERG
jgi:hypothetical protein